MPDNNVNVDIIDFDRVVFKNDQTPLNAENLNKLSDNLASVIDNTNLLTDAVQNAYVQILVESQEREQADNRI